MSSRWSDAWRALRKNRMAVTAGVVFTLVVLACAVGPWIAGAFGLDATTIVMLTEAFLTWSSGRSRSTLDQAS